VFRFGSGFTVREFILLGFGLPPGGETGEEIRVEPRKPNLELRSSNFEPNLNTNREGRRRSVNDGFYVPLSRSGVRLDLEG